MRLEELDYALPAAQIAQVPIEQRDAARLLVDRGSAAPLHRQVHDLPELLAPGDVVVLNDTRVIPARLRLRRGTGGAVEVLLLEPLDDQRRTWEALVRPARKLRLGEPLLDDEGDEVARIGSRTEAGDTFEVALAGASDPLDLIGRVGEMPLPPYITARLAHPERYQTVYASVPGSAAAPTAGLHLTDGVLDRLGERGIAVAAVELVVGLDTFQPIAAPDPLQHRMHSERYRVPATTLEQCRGARRVVAVGTTTVRALESAVTTGQLSGRTRLFIHRGYEFQLVDVLMTNFHLPRTTLLMMVDAFVGDRWRELYALAIDEGYRFLSFGDAMLLDRRAR